VISGFKAHNPLASMALIERVGQTRASGNE
jgi:hypothetical protein